MFVVGAMPRTGSTVRTRCFALPRRQPRLMSRPGVTACIGGRGGTGQCDRPRAATANCSSTGSATASAWTPTSTLPGGRQRRGARARAWRSPSSQGIYVPGEWGMRLEDIVTVDHRHGRRVTQSFGSQRAHRRLNDHAQLGPHAQRGPRETWLLRLSSRRALNTRRGVRGRPRRWLRCRGTRRSRHARRHRGGSRSPSWRRHRPAPHRRGVHHRTAGRR